MTSKEHEVSRSVSLIARSPGVIAMGKLIGWKASELQKEWERGEDQVPQPFLRAERFCMAGYQYRGQHPASYSRQHKGINVLVQCVGPLNH